MKNYQLESYSIQRYSFYRIWSYLLASLVIRIKFLFKYRNEYKGTVSKYLV
jgi:hypothetical protein